MELNSKELNSRGPHSSELDSRELRVGSWIVGRAAKDSAIYKNSNVTSANLDEISLLELHMKAHDVFHNLIQSISNNLI